MTARKFIFSVVGMAAVIGLLASEVRAGCGNCGPGCAKKCDAAAAKKPEVTCAAGAIKSVEDGKLVLTTDKGDVTLKVCPKAKIKIDGKDAKASDLKVGAAAKVCQVQSKKGDTVTIRVAVGGPCCPPKTK